jgi:hypothetical protein
MDKGNEPLEDGRKLDARDFGPASNVHVQWM